MNVAGDICFSVLAQANIAQPHESYLESVCRSAGPANCLIIVTTGLAVFIGACFVAAKCRRPSVIASYLFFLPLPLIVAFYGAVEGQMHSLIVLSSSPEVQPSASQIAAGVASALSPLFVAMTVTFPSYLVLVIGLMFCAAKAGKHSAD